MHSGNILKVIAAFLLSGVFVLGAPSLIQVEAAESVYQIENKSSNKDLSTIEKFYAINDQPADVARNNAEGHILLADSRINNKEDIYAEKLIVQNGKFKIYSEAGSGDALLFKNLDNNKTKDEMLSPATAESGGIVQHLAAPAKNNVSNVILEKKKTCSKIIDGRYMNGFLVKIEFVRLGKTVYVDLSSNKDLYIDLGIYNKNGGLLSETTPYTISFLRQNPMDYNGNRTYEIRGYQRVMGSCNTDTISVVESLWKYEDGEWHMVRLQYSTFLVK